MSVFLLHSTLLSPFKLAAATEQKQDFSLELLQYLGEFSSADGELIDPETMQIIQPANPCKRVNQVTKKVEPTTNQLSTKERLPLEAVAPTQAQAAQAPNNSTTDSQQRQNSDQNPHQPHKCQQEQPAS